MRVVPILSGILLLFVLSIVWSPRASAFPNSSPSRNFCDLPRSIMPLLNRPTATTKPSPHAAAQMQMSRMDSDADNSNADDSNCVKSGFYESLQSRIFRHRLEQIMVLSRNDPDSPSNNGTIVASFACPLEEIREVEQKAYHWSHGALNVQPSDYFEEMYLDDE